VKVKKMDTIGEIKSLKERLGDRLLILAHYYQKDEIFRLADVTGDSYQLALTASRSRSEFIVFCGVFFMAESARILTRPEQRVFLPDFGAGCPLADMVTAADCRDALDAIRRVSDGPVVPVLYINSTVSVKAAAAEAGGIVCTSSNAGLIVRGLLAEGATVFFIPDRNLGLNTARSLGLSAEEVMVYGRRSSPGELKRGVKLVVWDGFCNVHVKFSPADILKAKNLYPYARILVHPECPPEVVAQADYSGSTSGIIAETAKVSAGETIFIGTELNLVHRLAASRPDVKIFPLRESGCVNMNKITPKKLHAVLCSLEAPSSPFEVSVSGQDKDLALRALALMIERVERGRTGA
jgi:quinolinate synthase